MSYISEIFDRLDIQRVREFLLHGVADVEIRNKPYKQRVDEVERSVYAMIQAKFPDTDENEKITNEVDDLACAIEDVYMEIGMRCGAILIAQLLANPQKE